MLLFTILFCIASANTVHETVTITETSCPSISTSSPKLIQDFCQNKKSTCITTVMGYIPAVDRMPFALIKSPLDGDSFSSSRGNFKVELDVHNLELVPVDTIQSLFSGPQSLNEKGHLKGSIGLSVQYLGMNLNQIEIPDAENYDYFTPKGSDLTQFEITGLTKVGIYRVCTLMSAPTFQSLALPVAKRGSQNDCIRFTLTN